MIDRCCNRRTLVRSKRNRKNWIVSAFQVNSPVTKDTHKLGSDSLTNRASACSILISIHTLYPISYHFYTSKIFLNIVYVYL